MKKGNQVRKGGSSKALASQGKTACPITQFIVNRPKPSGRSSTYTRGKVFYYTPTPDIAAKIERFCKLLESSYEKAGAALVYTCLLWNSPKWKNRHGQLVRRVMRNLDL